MARYRRLWRVREVFGVGMAGVALVTALTACGGDDDAGGGSAAATTLPAPTQLIGLLPEEARMVAAIDVAALREALELPDDQGVDGRLDERTQPLADALATAIPFFANPRSTPIREELDTGAMIAAASVPIAIAPEQAVVVVRTSQSFDDLAAALEDRGYEREGDVLVIDGRVTEVGATAITATADDLLVLAQSSELARAVAAGEGDGPAAAELLEKVEGPLRVAALTGTDSDSCVESLAAGWVDPASGEVAITVGNPDDAGELELVPGSDDNQLAHDLDIETPRVEGRTVRAGFRWHGVGSPVGALFSAIPGSLYRCP